MKHLQPCTRIEELPRPALILAKVPAEWEDLYLDTICLVQVKMDIAQGGNGNVDCY